MLRFYPLHGKSFLPMQHLTDLNYSEVINFDEDDFIVPGPGALDGIRKCWGTIPAKISPSDIIRGCVEDQETFFQAVGEEPVRLFGRRRLHAIGCIPDALPEHIGPFRSTDSERRRSSLQDRYHPSHSFRRSGEFKSRGGPNVDLLRRRRPLY